MHQISRKNGMKEEGLLRLSGSSTEAKALKESFDKGENPNFNGCNDINSVGDVLKMYFRSLPQKPFLLTKGIKEASVLQDMNQRVNIMIDELRQIPEVNYFTLKRLFGFFKMLSINSSVTKMSPENLSIVFHPTLQIPQSIIILLITHPEVFSR